MVDLAVGIIIGGAFGKIVSSFVGDVALPLIGIIISDVPIKQIQVGPVALGSFLQAVIDFIMIALVVFVIVKIIHVIRRHEGGAVTSDTSTEEKLLTEIRDLLRNK